MGRSRSRSPVREKRIKKDKKRSPSSSDNEPYKVKKTDKKSSSKKPENGKVGVETRSKY